MTNHYSLAGTLLRDGVPVTDVDEISVITEHWMSAAGDYEQEGFRFVDADAHATCAEGFVSWNWSDYGLDEDVLDQAVLDHRTRRVAARREAEERRAAAHG